jgi:nitrogen fixation protein NifQ
MRRRRWRRPERRKKGVEARPGGLHGRDAPRIEAVTVGARPLLFDLDPAVCARRATRDDEVADLVALLLEHADPAAASPAEIERVAFTVAVASLGDNHLWQDLQLGSRAELSALMRHWFPALVALNHGDMKWKKFLYRELCRRAEVLICKAPSCEVCSDRHVCFGPET